MVASGSALVSLAEPKSGCGAEELTSPRRRFSVLRERLETPILERDDAVEAAGKINIVGGD